MFKTKDIYSMVLKATKNPAKTFFGELKEDGHNLKGFSPDGFRVYFMPDSEWIFDTDKLTKMGYRHITSLNKFIENIEEYEPATLTNELHADNKAICIKVKNDKTQCWINKDYLKPIPADATYLIKGEKSPMIVKWGGITIAIICPVFVKK